MESNTNNESTGPAISNPGEKIKPVKFDPPGKTDSRTRYSIHSSTVIILTSVLLCTGIAWYLFTAKAVYVVTTPADAHIRIQGGIQFKLADRYLLRSGEYILILEAEGYYPLNQDLTIGEDQNQYYTIELLRLPGHLQVETGQVTGADIFIDNVARGKAPVTIRDIPYGQHLVKVVADRYFPVEETIMINGMDLEQSINITLRPAWADVSFSSQPDSAEIFIDDELVGHTPLTAEVLEGKHTLRIKLTGHKVWQDDIKIIASQPVSIENITLEQADAVVFLVSDPPRASTTVNGEYMGLTPLELALTPEKNTTIRLFKQGYKSATRQITAQSGDKQRLNVNLAPELVSVEFKTEPADAKLFIDGVLRGAAKQTLKLTSIPHKIEVKKDGYVEYTTSITPLSGIAQQVNIQMKTLEQEKLEKIKPIITTSANQSLKLFYPGMFTMGASRREPGRGANETLRNIKLTRPFYLSLHEVTNEQFKQFATGHTSGKIESSSLDRDHQPVVNINWNQAAHYCNWLSQRDSLEPFYVEKDNQITGIKITANGYRLPTEAEWEWAARVTGNTQIKFPWGNEMPPTDKNGNYADRYAAEILGNIIKNYEDGFMITAPVGKFPANNKGLFDMGGNVAEWVNDYYHIPAQKNGKTETDPMGPKNGQSHVIRGSSWAHGTVTELRFSYRDYNTEGRNDVGFRIARFLE